MEPQPPRRTPRFPPRRSGDRFRAWAPDDPALVIAPLAWLKLMLFLHAGDTEVGGFGVSRGDDLLYLEDLATVRQRTTAVTVAFDDAAVADFFDDQVDAGLAPRQFGRIWVHTHPGDSPDPSMTDEETFARVFGTCDWAIMLIVSRTGRTYCRLSYSAGPGGAVLLPVIVDWAAWPEVLLGRAREFNSVFDGWVKEYGTNVEPVSWRPAGRGERGAGAAAASLEEEFFWLFDGDGEGDDLFAEHERQGLLNRFAELFEGSAVAAGEVAS